MTNAVYVDELNADNIFEETASVVVVEIPRLAFLLNIIKFERIFDLKSDSLILIN